MQGGATTTTPPDSVEITVRPPCADDQQHPPPEDGGADGYLEEGWSPDRGGGSLARRFRQISLARQASGSTNIIEDRMRQLLHNARPPRSPGTTGSEDTAELMRPNDDASSTEALYEEHTTSSYARDEDPTTFDFSCLDRNPGHLPSVFSVIPGGGAVGASSDTPSALPPPIGVHTSPTPPGAGQSPSPASPVPPRPRFHHFPTFGNSTGDMNPERSPRTRGWSPSHDETMRRWKSQAFVYMQLQRDAYEFYRLVYNILTLPLIVMTIAAGILVNTDECGNNHLVVRIIVSVLSLTSTLLAALLRQIQPAELSQEHKGVSANYHILLHSMEFCMRVPYHMRPDATVYMEKVRNDMDRLIIKQSSPPLFVVRSYEKRIGGIDGIMYGDDVVNVMLNNVKTDVMLQQLKGEGRTKLVSNAVDDVLNLIKRSRTTRNLPSGR